jgi:ligand-binding SRPBCC domain-containing protein
VEVVEVYPLPPAEVFAFFARPANVIAAAPEGAGLRLVAEGKGEYTVEARRWGLVVRIVTEVVERRDGELIVERQRRGPFASWRLTRTFRAVEGGAELREVVEFEPPGGLLGLTLTAVRAEAELREAYRGRPERVLALLGPARVDRASEGGR